MKRSSIIVALAAAGLLVLPPALRTQDSAQRVLEFDDVSESEVGEFPAKWQWRRHRSTGDDEQAAREEGVDVSRWVVEEEDGNRYIHIRDEYRPGHSVSLFLDDDQFDWDLREYPILSWRWRVNEIPPGADERYTETNDIPASVAVVYGTRWRIWPITIKWVWSSTLPLGAVAHRGGRGQAHTVVLGTGTDRLGEWITVERNIVEDYIAIFGEEPPDHPKAIQISTDANRTEGAASEADYDDFKALSTYSPGFPKEPRVLLMEYVEGKG